MYIRYHARRAGSFKKVIFIPHVASTAVSAPTLEPDGVRRHSSGSFVVVVLVTASPGDCDNFTGIKSVQICVLYFSGVLYFLFLL